jgi:hypothetical protein
VIENINLDWPPSNFGIFNIFLDGKMIWAQGDPSPPTNISSFTGSTSDRRVNSSGVLEALFGNDAASSGYSLEIRFDNGCSIR